MSQIKRNMCTYYTAPTKQHELDRTDRTYHTYHTDQEYIYLSALRSE